MTNLNFTAIGLKIKERRKELGYTQDYVASMLDVNPSHISNIEAGRANPSLTALVQIANVLECSVDRFLDSEYTYELSAHSSQTLDDKILAKLKHCNIEKKNKLLQIIDIL